MICIGKTKCTSEKGLFKSNSAVHSRPLVTGFALAPRVPRYLNVFRARAIKYARINCGGKFALLFMLCRHIGLLFGKRLDTLSDSLRIYFFHLIWRKYPDSMSNLSDACGRKTYPERKSCEFKNIRIRVDRTLMNWEVCIFKHLRRDLKIRRIAEYL